MKDYLDAVRERVVIFDGATGTNLMLRELSLDDYGGPQFEGCPEILNVTRPDVIRDLHRSFFEVGVDVVETNSFGGSPVTLAEYGIPERAHELCVLAAQLAREVADGYGGFVAGSVGPGTKLVTLGHVSFVDARDGFEIQARGLLEGGVDPLQGKAAVQACRRAMKAVGRVVPLQVQMQFDLTGRMLLGTEIGAALTTFLPLRPDVFGLNCATGPAEMGEHLRHLSHYSPVPISCIPNAGLPSVVDG
jgi:5-methyltetrahydrofolate--homocysteine methyltransferase